MPAPPALRLVPLPRPSWPSDQASWPVRQPARQRPGGPADQAGQAGQQARQLAGSQPHAAGQLAGRRALFGVSSNSPCQKAANCCCSAPFFICFLRSPLFLPRGVRKPEGPSRTSEALQGGIYRQGPTSLARTPTCVGIMSPTGTPAPLHRVRMRRNLFNINMPCFTPLLVSRATFGWPECQCSTPTRPQQCTLSYSWGLLERQAGQFAMAVSLSPLAQL